MTWMRELIRGELYRLRYCCCKLDSYVGHIQDQLDDNTPQFQPQLFDGPAS